MANQEFSIEKLSLIVDLYNENQARVTLLANKKLFGEDLTVEEANELSILRDNQKSLQGLIGRSFIYGINNGDIRA